MLGITEAKLDITINNEEVKIDGYNLTLSDRNRKGGSIACYVKTIKSLLSSSWKPQWKYCKDSDRQLDT